MPAPEVFLSAAEVSGDLHGGNLLAALRRERPDLRAWGVGGERLAAAGQEQVAGIDRLSLMGFTEVVPRLASILELIRELKLELTRRRPAVVVLIDAPEFNFRLAAHARSLGLKVVYYISPKVWAWRKGRIATLRRTVDHMLCILPFEEELYRSNGVRATFVGHPLVESVRPAAPPAELRAGFGFDPSQPVVALLPGSRQSELRALLPSLLGAATLLERRTPRPRFLIPAATDALYAALRPLEGEHPGITVVRGRAYDCLAVADAAVVASGTATLEAALIGTPFVAVYRVSRITYLLGRLLVRLRWASLPNILLNEPAVRELIQGECRPDEIAAEVARLLDDHAAAARLRERFTVMKGLLGPPGASQRAAAAIAGEMGSTSAPAPPGASREGD
jgi:lipid-A-disaccharide synthase